MSKRAAAGADGGDAKRRSAASGTAEGDYSDAALARREGRRGRLADAYEAALSRVVADYPFSAFAEHMPPAPAGADADAADAHLRALQTLYGTFVRTIVKSAREELDDIVAERRLDAKLVELDARADAAKARAPQRHAASVLDDAKQKHAGELDKDVQKANAENAKLRDELRTLYTTKRELVEALRASVAALDANVATVNAAE